MPSKNGSQGLKPPLKTQPAKISDTKASLVLSDEAMHVLCDKCTDMSQLVGSLAAARTKMSGNDSAKDLHDAQSAIDKQLEVFRGQLSGWYGVYKVSRARASKPEVTAAHFRSWLKNFIPVVAKLEEKLGQWTTEARPMIMGVYKGIVQNYLAMQDAVNKAGQT